MLDVSQYTAKEINLTSWVYINQPSQCPNPFKKKIDLFKPLRQYLDRLNVRDRAFAHRLCKLIPSQCPFERDIKVLGKVLFHIPPLCKLNPLYEDLVSLRFRAICYLADECGEDVTAYC